MRLRPVLPIAVLVLLTGLVALPASAQLESAIGASDGPTIQPQNEADLAVNDTSSNFVDVGGTVPTSEQISSATFIGFDAAGREVVSDPVPSSAIRPPTPFGQYVHNNGGELDGNLRLGCVFGAPQPAGSDCPHPPVRSVLLRLVIGGQTYDSNTLPVDYDPPTVRSFEVVSPTRILVTFSEAVRHDQGDSPSDYDVSNPDRRVLRVEGPRENDCAGVPTARPDIRMTGCTRTIVLDQPLEEDPRGVTVAYEPTTTVDEQPIPGRSAHEDFASLNAPFQLAPMAALDLIRPALPRITSVDGKPPASPVVGSSRTVTVTVTNVTDGHQVRIETKAPDGTTITGPWVTAADGTAAPTIGPLPDPEATYQLTAVVKDPAGNLSTEGSKSTARQDASPSTVAYALDVVAPTALTAVADGRFITVRFSEPIVGTNRPGDWAVASGGPVEAVSGSGDTRVIRTAAPAGGSISYAPPTDTDTVKRFRDRAGNPLPAFKLDILRPGDLVLSRASATEGSPLEFAVAVARPHDDNATYAVDFTTEDGTATAGEDFTAQSGRLTFGPGVHTRTVSVPTVKDERSEGSETMSLRLSNPGGGATLPNPATATGTILDPGTVAGPAEISIFDTRAHEGTTARAVVQLASAATKDVTVRWATTDGTAKAGEDYRASSGTLRIAAGAREAIAVVPLVDDGRDEPTENFTIRLSDPANATLARTTATVSILDGLGVAPGIGRVSGPSRVETSAAVSKAFYATADTVVIATANTYPDALAGAPLAEKHAAPILLTTRERLHPAIATEVRRLGAKTALVLGGPGALSSQVDRDLRAAGVTTVRRFAGTNRFDTARLIAADVGGDAVYVVEGNNRDPKRGWPDAVAVSALAASQQRPILLVERDRLPGETSAALTRLSPSRATIVGGPGAVNDSVARAVDARAGTVDRVAGRTRYETSRAVASRSVSAGYDPGNTFFATGDDWPDSLAASPAVARTGGILLLVDSDRLDDSPPAREWLVTHRDRLRSITLIGGSKAISDGVREQIRSQSGLEPR